MHKAQRKDEVGTAELLQNEEHLTYFLFQPEKILFEEIFPNPSHANSSYGWLDCIKLIGEKKIRKSFNSNNLNYQAISESNAYQGFKNLSKLKEK